MKKDGWVSVENDGIVVKWEIEDTSLQSIENKIFYLGLAIREMLSHIFSTSYLENNKFYREGKGDEVKAEIKNLCNKVLESAMRTNAGNLPFEAEIKNE